MIGKNEVEHVVTYVTLNGCVSVYVVKQAGGGSATNGAIQPSFSRTVKTYILRLKKIMHTKH